MAKKKVSSTKKKVEEQDVLEIKITNSKIETGNKELLESIIESIKEPVKEPQITDLSNLFNQINNINSFIGKTITDAKCDKCGKKLYQVEISATKKFINSKSKPICKECLTKYMNMDKNKYDELCAYFINSGCQVFNK